MLVSERPLAQAVKSFERADPITLPFISPESKFDPGNLIGRLKKRFLKGLLLVKCTMISAKPVLLNVKTKMADVDLLLFEIASGLKSTVDSKFLEFDHLKLEQVLSIVQFVMRKDVFAVLPTGFGKSVIFQVIPSICSMLAARGLDYPEKPITVVICPLVSLINSHIQELRSHGFSAACLSGDDIDEKGIERGDYSFIFTSPESVIRNEKWRKMLRTNVYQE